MQDYRKLDVWQRAHQLVLAVYTASAAFPGREAYSLTDQTRRAATSLPANIAEGCGRETTAELRRFLFIAMGSASELDYHLLLAHDLNYLDATIYQRLNDELNIIRRMLNALIQKLTTRN